MKHKIVTSTQNRTGILLTEARECIAHNRTKAVANLNSVGIDARTSDKILFEKQKDLIEVKVER